MGGDGYALLDAPLDGGREGALEGQLTLFVGGDEAVLRRVKPVLDTFSRSVVWVGELGAGSITKIVHNALAMSIDLLLAECSLPEEMAMDSHLTPERAGDLAREAGARRLVLTHFYPPVETSDPARAAGARFAGPVAAARDGDRFIIGGAERC